MGEDEKFKSDVLVALAKIDAHNEAHVLALKALDKRTCDLENTIDGNKTTGQVGIAEQVRGIERKIAIFGTGIALAVKFGFDFLHKKAGG